MKGLAGIRVVDFSTDIAGPYATKLLVDAGADVVKVEPATGDPLRHWSATRGELPAGEDGALFRFLNAGKRGIVGEPGDARIAELMAAADLVVESFEPGVIDEVIGGLTPEGSGGATAEPDLHELPPGLVVLSISNFGRGGPWSRRPATEFTIQAGCGSIGTRGLPGREPFQVGGRTAEWVAGTYASVAALAAVQRARRDGAGEHVDFSIFEVMTIAGTNYMDLVYRLLGIAEPTGPAQSIETPSIEPTADHYVGFCTNTRQQLADFMLLIGQPELREDEGLAQVAGRVARLDEWNALVHAYTRRHTTREVIEAASVLRIPVAPINNGDTVRNHEQLVARDVFRTAPDDGFVYPRPPYRLNDNDPPLQRAAPGLGENDDDIASWGWRERDLEPRADAREPRELPLAGLRIIDLTAWWAGPSATHMLATLGADVIHLEATSRPDGMRMVGGMMAKREQRWWECSQFYLACNNNKRGLTLDLTTPRGLALCRALIATSDAVVENFTPRVLDGFGLTWEAIQKLNPRTILVRMPAFGLTGPWRDNTGFAQTMEQMTGLAWLTGHRADQPRIQRGPCDPLAGMHAAFALLVALEERAATNRGVHVECTMVEGALNAAAEQLVEFTAHGVLMEREGNRAPHAAPQGLYPCAGHTVEHPQWLALSIVSDAQWQSLTKVLGLPGVGGANAAANADWASAPEFAHRAERRAAHDRIDAWLRERLATRSLEQTVEVLVGAGVPAAEVADPRTVSRNPHLRARKFFENSTHPVVGDHPIPTVPFRYRSVDHWIRTPAPTMGQHNREILEELGVDEKELRDLAAQGIIGDRPVGH